MHSDKQDQVIKKLYQQRKASIELPSVSLLDNKAIHSSAVNNNDRGVSWGKLLIILFGGGVASFSLFAVMSYLVSSPKPRQTIQQNTVNYEQIEYQESDLDELSKQAVQKELDSIINELPELPKETVIYRSLSNAEQSTQQNIEYSIDDASFVTVINKVNVELNHQVVPEYPVSAIIEQQQGQVSLSYQIKDNGKVSNIHVTSSEGSRLFEKSAIKALSEWQYSIDSLETIIDTDKHYDIIFEFSLPPLKDK